MEHLLEILKNFWCGGVVIVFVLGAYFLPSIIAYNRNRPNYISIFIINLFFGWTLIGWVVCLAWACANTTVPTTQEQAKVQSA